MLGVRYLSHVSFQVNEGGRRSKYPWAPEYQNSVPWTPDVFQGPDGAEKLRRKCIEIGDIHV